MDYNLITSEIKDENVKVFCLDSVDSTSSYLRRFLDSGNTSKAVAIAKTQTGGRGRSGKSFYSPDGGGLYMSVLIHPGVSFDKVSSLTSRVCVAVCRCIENVCGISTDIKWVNDLYLNGRKVCGILCEAINDYGRGVTKSVIIGVGINLSTSAFPEDIKETAGSLNVSDEYRDKLASELAKALLQLKFGELTQSELDYYRRKSLVLGKRIIYTFNGQKNTAEAVAIDSSGGLVVKNDNGNTVTLTSGEISVRLG